MSPLNRAITAVVLASIATAILESEPLIEQRAPAVFITLNTAFAVLFTVEYVVRLWSVSEDSYHAGFVGRLRYAGTLASVVDLVATLALWISVLTSIGGVYGVLLRLVRVLRVVSLARRSRWASALRCLASAIRERRRELSLSFGLSGVALVVSASVLFVVEGKAQPH